jgi:hypothetical protein
MDPATRIAGWVGYSLGAAVLLSYAANYTAIQKSAVALKRRKCVFGAWIASAVATAVCFLLVVALWAMRGNNVTHNNNAAVFYTVGLFVFMAGAVAWAWLLTPEKTTTAELAALWATAAGSVIMFAATLQQPMSVAFTAYIMFHHVVVDGMWWPAWGRRA